MRFAEYELRERERQLIGPDGPVELSSRSFDILALLLARPHETVDKTAIFDAVWPGVVVGENTLQVHVSSLRKLLGSGMIATVHGRGYKYVGPLPASSPAFMAHAGRTQGNVLQFRGECVGREVEIAALSGLLRANRLVSLLGPGASERRRWRLKPSRAWRSKARVQRGWSTSRPSRIRSTCCRRW